MFELPLIKYEVYLDLAAVPESVEIVLGMVLSAWEAQRERQAVRRLKDDWYGSWRFVKLR